MSDRFIYILVFIVYIAFCLSISAIVKKKETRQDSKGFLLGDRSIGPWPIAFSFVATLVSASLFMGSGPKIYAQGWSFAIYGLLLLNVGIVLAWILYAKRLSRLTTKFNALTLAELFHYRYHSRGIKIFSSVATIVVYIPLMGAQLVAAGKLFKSIFGLPFWSGIVLVGGVLTVVTAVGGFKSVVYNDFFQGIIMYGIFFVLVPIMVHKVGGLTAMNTRLVSEFPQFFVMHNDYWNPVMITSWVFYFIFGLNLAQPSLLVRFLACKDTKVIKRAFPLAVTCHAFGIFSVAIIMMAAALLFPGITDRETIFPTIVTNLLPPVVGGMAICAVFACMMSTVDSLMLVASGSFTEDIYKGFLNPKATEKETYNVGIISTVVIGIGSILTAIYSGKGVLELIVLAESCLIPIYLFSVLGVTHMKRLTPAGVLAGMIAGAIVAFVWELVYSWDICVPVMPAILVCAVVTLAVSRLTPAPDAVVTDAFWGKTTKEELEAYYSRR